jgi:hypothetical protein
MLQTYLAQFRFGRVLLHLGAACRDRKYRWHWRGIWRELAKRPVVSPSSL